jgi:hypothetical protein
MEAACFSETLVFTNDSTRRRNPGHRDSVNFRLERLHWGTGGRFVYKIVYDVIVSSFPCCSFCWVRTRSEMTKTFYLLLSRCIFTAFAPVKCYSVQIVVLGLWRRPVVKELTTVSEQRIASVFRVKVSQVTNQPSNQKAEGGVLSEAQGVFHYSVKPFLRTKRTAGNVKQFLLNCNWGCASVTGLLSWLKALKCVGQAGTWICFVEKGVRNRGLEWQTDLYPKRLTSREDV